MEKIDMNSSTELELNDINTEETSLKNIDKNWGFGDIFGI